MNERGIISLTALCMMLILSLSIAGVANMAARQADMTRYYRIENQLQCAAESAFNEAIVKISNDEIYDSDYSHEMTVNDIKVTLYLKKYQFTPSSSDESTHCFRIVIMTLAEKENFNLGKYSAYRRVFGYMERTGTLNPETGELDYDGDGKYKFRGYIY